MISADSRKAETMLGSPVISIKLDKSPSVVGGRLERFGDIRDMIGYWEDDKPVQECSQEGEGGREGAEESVTYVNFLREGRGAWRNIQPRTQFLKWGQGGGV